MTSVTKLKNQSHMSDVKSHSRHIPVLLDKVLEFLNPSPGKFVIDGTLGSGGHAMEIIKRLSGEAKFLGIDWDKEAVEQFRGRIEGIKDVEVVLVSDSYANLPEILQEKKLGKADGLLLDLGFSSEQLEKGKGFSFLKREEPLIMTYSEKTSPLYEVLPELSERELTKIISEYSNERYAERIGKAIFEKERKESIIKVGELVETIESAVPKNYEGGRIHPATRTFMALRIYVNDELGNLEKLLERLPSILKEGGKSVIISYHSSEDRLVKNHFREMEKRGEAEILTKKVLKPEWSEVKKNPRSRGAKLRAIKLI